MSTTTDLRILVISDIHAINNDPNASDAISYFSTRPTSLHSASTNPFLSIPTILKQNNLEVDWILCPGDLADRAEPTAQAVTWTQLESLRQSLNAKRLVGTVGNHDVDSRLDFDEFDTKGALQSLAPYFPGLSEEQCDFYWSRNFVVLDEEDTRLLVLNSSAFHGINSDKAGAAKEYQHGRVSDRTISAIDAALWNQPKPLQILLIHHHVYKNDRIFARDYSDMKNAGKLLELLKSKHGDWVVIHGHQHYPMISYATGDANSPIIFSAGSFSRKLNEISTENANQFYHITFPIAQYAQLGWKGCGTCRAWDWSPGHGWVEARGNAKIPSRAGFGCRESTSRITSQIQAIISSSASAVNWSELTTQIPSLPYMLPSEIERLVKELQSVGIVTYGSPFGDRCQMAQS